MSRPLFYATISGGVLRSTNEGDHFTVKGVDDYDPLALFLSKEEAAQWAAVLTEYAVTP